MGSKQKRLAGAFFVVGVVLSLTACSGSSQPTATLAIPSGAVVVRAVNSIFEPATQNVPSGQAFTLYFDNADSLPHNVVLLGPGDSRTFAGPVFTGPKQEVYEIRALAAGTYKLRCDVHPDMTGTLTAP